jgi:hypothetical protein
MKSKAERAGCGVTHLGMAHTMDCWRHSPNPESRGYGIFVSPGWPKGDTFDNDRLSVMKAEEMVRE